MFGVWGLELQHFEVWGLRLQCFGVWGLVLHCFWIWGLGFVVVGYNVYGFGFRVTMF